MTTLPQPLTLDSFAGLPPEHQPTVRTYTVRRADPAARQITVDFVVHGEHGVAVRRGDVSVLLPETPASP